MKSVLFRVLSFAVVTVVAFIIYSGWTIPERSIYSITLSVWINQIIDALERMET